MERQGSAAQGGVPRPECRGSEDTGGRSRLCSPGGGGAQRGAKGSTATTVGERQGGVPNVCAGGKASRMERRAGYPRVVLSVLPV